MNYPFQTYGDVLGVSTLPSQPFCETSSIEQWVSFDPSFFAKAQFHKLTLTREEFTTAAGIFTGINLLLCFGFWTFITEKKKLSWGLSLVNSFVLSVTGLTYIYRKLPQIHNVLLTGTGGDTLLHSVDDVSALVCLWFAIVNVADLFFGMLCYSQHLGWFTAVIHHPFYVWVMIVGTSGNGLFFRMEPFASAFMFASIEEIPTLLLAIGSMVPSLRTDMGFGFSFFLLRVCYQFWMLAYTVRLKLPLSSIVIPGLAFAMHVYWFWGWACKYGPRLFTEIPRVP